MFFHLETVHSVLLLRASVLVHQESLQDPIPKRKIRKQIEVLSQVVYKTPIIENKTLTAYLIDLTSQQDCKAVVIIPVSPIHSNE